MLSAVLLRRSNLRLCEQTCDAKFSSIHANRDRERGGQRNDIAVQSLEPFFPHGLTHLGTEL